MKLMLKQTNKKTRFLRTVFFVILIFTITYFIWSITGVHTACRMRAFTGMPCPGCGMTRAYLSLLHGNIKEAFFYHPLFLLPVFILILLALQSKKGVKIPKALWIAILVLLLLVYLVRMLLFFPDTEPMTYYPDAYLPRFVLKILSFFSAR